MLVWTTNIEAQEVRNATHYGESYNGSGMSCTGRLYYSSDLTLVALSYADKAIYPCGTPLIIRGPYGQIEVTVTDTCPGCTNQVDLSEAGITAVCGGLGSCQVTISQP